MTVMSRVIPLILDELQRRDGQANEKDLYESVARSLGSKYGLELTFKEFNRILLVLETRGFIRVSYIKKGLRAVQLIQGNLREKQHQGERGGG